MKVAILGCGPAGLLAAHAAVVGGVDMEDITIYSKVRKSELHGAQYMGRDFPWLIMGPPMEIRYNLHGTVQDYRRKVYGKAWNGDVSPDDFEGDHKAWNIRAMYDSLWIMYADRIKAARVGPGWIGQSLPRTYDRIFSSIPRNRTCAKPREHEFLSQSIWAIGDSQQRRAHYPCDPNTINCHAGLLPSYYRIANVFGYKTVEWPMVALDINRFAVQVEKPLITDCDCWNDEIVPIGRYGMWKKGILVHHVYQTVMESL